MKTRFCNKLIVYLVISVSFLFAFANSVVAQVITLNPATSSKSIGTEFSVDLNIDTAGKAVAGADVKLTFDPQILEIVSVDKGTFFTDGANNVSGGNLYIAGFFPEQFETKTGVGKLATIKLKGKASGTASLNFICTSSTVDTNILDSSSNDIVLCSRMANGSYVFTGGVGGPTSTPGPQLTGTPVPQPTVTPVITVTPTPPVSGITFPTYLSIGAGIILLIAGLVIAL